MPRLFGLYTNRCTAIAPILAIAGDRVRIPAADNPHGFGLGYTHGAQVLLQRRPQIHDQPVDLVSAIGDIQSTALIAHVRHAGVGGLKPQNLGPFRYGPWVYGQVGTLPDADRLVGLFRDQIIDSLRHNIGGDTDAELLFHVFLSRLHDAGISTRQWAVDSDIIVQVLLDTLEHWRLCTHRATDRKDATGTQDRSAGVALVLSNGQAMFALSLGRRLGYVPLIIDGNQVLPGDPADLSPSKSATDSAHRAVLIVDEEPVPPLDPFVPMADGQVVSIDQTFTMSTHPVPEPLLRQW